MTTHRWAGKGSCYEGGIRVPLLLRWPGRVEAGSVIQTPVHVVDLAATFLELAGARPPRQHQLDGASLVELLTRGKAGSLSSRPLYQFYPFYDLRWGLTPCAAVRRGDYKLIEFFGDRVDDTGQYVYGHSIELYNLRDDLGESNNLAQTLPKLATELHRYLRNWITEV